MDVLVIPDDRADGAEWAEGLRGNGFLVAAAAWPPDAARPAAVVILDRPAPEMLGQRLATLAAHPALAEAVVLVRTDDADSRRHCRLAGAFPLPVGAGGDCGAATLLLALRLWGETARRRTLEDDRQRLAAERAALSALAPFAGAGEILSPETGRYRARRLLTYGPATVLVLAIDDFDGLRRGFGLETAARAEDAVAALLAETPARLGDMACGRGPGLGWIIWLAGDTRASASALAHALLDRVRAAGLTASPLRAEARITISAGIAPAPARSDAEAAEEAAEAALRLAASLGGDRIRWAG
ncbi:hypothetical protein L2U69_13665 [Zavarzinia compransoris]|uniref:hypothetical protein n=1 Tax=Zavarzinia marina TaxID=2911065 RepID=UPI001F1EEE9B|nr:hypothetical protein [Zavarzinia marina]MCF4166695.1 hypothetical protein [Zavarzinia marina]